MPIVLYSVREACNWLHVNGKEITEKGLRKAMKRGSVPFKVMGSTYVLCEDDLQGFLDNPPPLGRRPK